MVAAPTGVAALNANGVTLHSLFLLPFTPYITQDVHFEQKRKQFQRISKKKQDLIRSIELLVIDEISMVRADMFDAVDDVLRRVRKSTRPFGGVQLMLIGDVEQLAPVCKEEDWELLKEYYKSPFFFDAHVFQKCEFIKIELKEIFRQKEPKFTEMLNAIRENRITEEIVQAFNSRYVPNFSPSDEEGYITLVTHIRDAECINCKKMEELLGKARYYKAQIMNDFPEKLYPNDEHLEMKVGAQIMFIKNGHTADKKYFYNGMMGHVETMREHDIVVRIPSGELITVAPLEWHNRSYALNKETGEIEETILGVYSQLPVRTAWAITIHKSQGLTFDRVVIDVDKAFAHGQTYVGFSRCKTLEGMVLATPFTRTAVIKDGHVSAFSAEVQQSEVPDEKLHELKKMHYSETLCATFDLQRLSRYTNDLSYIVTRHLSDEYTLLAKELQIATELIKKESDTANKFQMQIKRLIIASDAYFNDSLLQERIEKAAGYFSNITSTLKPITSQLSYLSADAKELNKKLESLKKEWVEELILKETLFETYTAESFTIENYRGLKMKSICGELVRERNCP